MHEFDSKTRRKMLEEECVDCGRRFENRYKNCPHCGYVNWNHFSLLNMTYSPAAAYLVRRMRSGSNVPTQLRYEDDL